MSTDPSPEDRIRQLRKRLDRVETAVSELQSTVAAMEEGHSDEAPEARAAANPETGETDPSPGATSGLRTSLVAAMPTPDLRSADWLSYAGVGLLLFGLAFLFKYSVEQGWITPVVRVGFGATLGGVLLGAGLRVYARRRRLRQVLLGGSSAAFYGTVFAAFELYGLLPYALAFASMVAIAVGTVGLAVREDEAPLAVVGTAGGLGTPFLLYTETAGVAGLTGYTLLVLVGACAVYVNRGWRSLLYTTVGGGWIVLLVPCLDAFVGSRPPGAAVLQAGLAGAWLLLGATPLLRMVRGKEAGRPESGRPAHALIPVSPGAALLGARLLGFGGEVLWAGIAGSGALVYAGVYRGLQRRGRARYAAVHGLVAAALVAYALALGLNGAALLLAWAVEATGLLVLGRRREAATVRWSGMGLGVAVAGWMVIRLAEPTPAATPVVAPPALSELAVLGLGWGAARYVPGHRWGRRLLRVGVLAGGLGWWWNELVPVAYGQAYVSVAWGATAVLLLVMGVWRRSVSFQRAGLATLALFVGKLFWIDLAALSAPGRIALFLGAGAAFLSISYALPGVGPGDSD